MASSAASSSFSLNGVKPNSKTVVDTIRKLLMVFFLLLVLVSFNFLKKCAWAEFLFS